MTYVVYRRVYQGPIGRSKPIGRTTRLSRALTACRDRNASRKPGEWYGVETADGRPVDHPAFASLLPCSPVSVEQAEPEELTLADCE